MQSELSRKAPYYLTAAILAPIFRYLVYQIPNHSLLFCLLDGHIPESHLQMSSGAAEFNHAIVLKEVDQCSVVDSDTQSLPYAHDFPAYRYL